MLRKYLKLLNTAVPTGVVSFTMDGIAVGSASLGNGVAYLTFTPASSTLTLVGVHTVAMQYGGDANYSAAGFSTTHTIIARTIPVTIALNASPTSALRSQTIRLTVSTSAPDSTITPAISFSDNGLSLGTSTILHGIGQLDTNLLAVGTHTIAATYLGLTNSFAGTAYPTTTSLPVTVVISAVPTTTTLAASASTLTSGNPITLMAATTSTATTPFGSVSFYDGASLLGTSLAINGQASWATSFTSTGDHSLTAVFQNNETFAGSTSAAVAVHSMTAAGAAPSSLALTVRDSGPTGSVSLVATLASVATRSELSNRQVGFFALTVSGAPSGVTINPASFTLSPAGTQTITIFAGLTVAAGASTLSISGASGSLHHSGTLALTLQAAPAGSLSRLKYVRTDSTLGADLSFFPQAHILYSASSRRFFFADASLNRIHVFNAATEQKIGEVVVPGAYQLDESPDGKTLWVGTQVGDVYTVDPSTLAVTHRYPSSQIGSSGYAAFEVHPLSDGTIALLGGQGGIAAVDGYLSFAIWTPATNSLKTPTMCVDGIALFAATADRTRLIMTSFSSSGGLCLYTPSSDSAVKTVVNSYFAFSKSILVPLDNQEILVSDGHEFNVFSLPELQITDKVAVQGRACSATMATHSLCSVQTSSVRTPSMLTTGGHMRVSAGRLPSTSGSAMAIIIPPLRPLPWMKPA